MASETPSSLFRAATTKKNILSVYHKHVVASKARGRDGLRGSDIGDDFDRIAALMSSRLRDGSYRFTQYREHLISRGAKREPRSISVPTARDRVALRVLADYLGAVFPAAQGKISQIHVARLASVLEAESFTAAVRIDLKDFYPSIPHEAVVSGLHTRIKKPEVLTVIERAIKTPTAPDGPKSSTRRTRGVPQGLAISNLLSELVAQRAEESIRKIHGLNYFRFVDDVLILCETSNANLILKDATETLLAAGLKPHAPSRAGGKTYIAELESGFEFLGYSFRNHCIGVRKSSILRLEKTLAKAFTGFRRDSQRLSHQAAVKRWVGRINIKITGCVWQHSHRGWVQYFRQMNDLTVLRELDATVTSLAKQKNFPTNVPLKRFVRTFWAVTYPNDDVDRYVPNFDNYSLTQKRFFLFDYFTQEEVEEMNEMEVLIAFARTVNELVADMERDIALTY